MKRFLMFSVSVFCLAVAALIGFYIGSHEVEAQVHGSIVGFNSVGNDYRIITGNGDIYYRVTVATNGGPWASNLIFIGNIWEGEPVSTEQNSWGEIKGQFKK